MPGNRRRRPSLPELLDSFRQTLPDYKKMIDRAINSDWHNVFVIWAELGMGKTSLMLQLLHRTLQDWDKVLSFILEPKICLKCGYTWDSGNKYVFEASCPKCGKETKTTDVLTAASASHKEWFVSPFPYDYNTGRLRQFPAGQEFIINSSKALGRITQVYPYLNFSFDEVRTSIEKAVRTRIKMPLLGWDDIAVYFHRSNIQYMHPVVKNFFSRYNFIRKYVANVIITVPNPEFVPQQLLLFCTGDIMIVRRGFGDFDKNKTLRNFFGQNKTWTKHIDGTNVEWDKVPEEVFNAYEEIRHAHAVRAFEHPEEVLVTAMPQEGKSFANEPSLFDEDDKEA